MRALHPFQQRVKSHSHGRMEMRSLLLAAISAGMLIIGTAGAPAADLSPIRVAPPPPPPLAPVANWSGHYAGVQLGWANVRGQIDGGIRSEEHTSELQS